MSVDPWKLLEEARKSVEYHYDKLVCDDPKVADLIDLDARIDAALAERSADLATLAAALRASCVPGCSHEGEWVDSEHEAKREEAYHKGFIALGDVRCGYCGQDHRKET